MIWADRRQIRRFRSANGRRDRFLLGACYITVMELLLIILGGALSTAIIFMIVDRMRSGVSDDDDKLDP